MSIVLQNFGTFLVFGLVAMFTQNAVFTRALGVSRLVKLVGDSAVDSMVFCALLCLVQVISMPISFFANGLIANYWFRDYIRPLVYVLCAVVAFVIVMVLIALVRPPKGKEVLAVLPMATFNVAVLGPLLLVQAYSYTFVQAMGFALGSGLGYAFAVLLVSEGQRKLNNRSIPAAFRGLPINLIYIGILAIAIFGLTGQRQAI